MTSGVVFPPEHRLYVYCDTALHWDCYARWPDREEFARAYWQAGVKAEHDNPYWGKALLTDAVLVTVNPNLSQVSVDLAATGSDIRVPLEQWEQWLSKGEADTEGGNHPAERRALAAIIPLLRAKLPTTQTIVDAVDWEVKRQVLERHRQQTPQAEEARLHKPSAHNKACRVLKRHRVMCPFCGTIDSQFMDKGPEVKGEFVCPECGMTFGPVEVTLKRLYG